ncbi:hypothetical protein H072_1518 [Dactylellina haptotyla CBS 200.50]|uniref:FAD-binding domain-containing protein n=1 Tax=Dactylellina haptotyla (strain CBS 200.50) TaxID=1284197 RepID=S8C9Y9_DACHA|nr:hypothetical protein H072_1518 [Dactylellina haptotyla CBS 200.50]
MKIVIVGTGISGLSAYHFLHRFLTPIVPDLEIDAYESYSSPSIGVGGNLGLAPNGLYTIKLISEEAHSNILASGFACSRFEMRNSKGKVLGLMSAGSPDRYPGTGGEVMHSRAVIYEEILKVLEAQGAKMHYGKTVTTVTPRENGVEVTFADGETIMADLVVGADGIKSTVRKAAFPGVEARFEGLVGVGSTIPYSAVPTSEHPKELPYNYKNAKSSPIVMTFGSNGFFGYSPINSKMGEEGRYQWWSTAESDSENRDLSIEEIERQLTERHKDWVSPNGQKVVDTIVRFAIQQHKEAGETDRSKKILVLPNYYMQIMEKYNSNDGKILLVGDAAHVMPPHSGQGVSLASEDGYVYAKLLAHEIERTKATESKDYKEALATAGRYYTEMRKPRNDKIMAAAARAGNTKRNLSWWEEKSRDFFFGLFLRFAPEGMHDGTYGYKADVEVENFLKTKP